MDNIIGITGKDFVLLASSNAITRGPTTLSDTAKRIHQFNSQTMVAAVGESGDLTTFTEYLQGNVALYSFRNSFDLEPTEVAELARTELATLLRSRDAKMVNLLVAGVNKREGNKPYLYFVDYLGAMAKVPYGAHGYAQYYCLSLLDKHHKPDVDRDGAIKLFKLCLAELNKRLPIDFKGMTVKILSPTGVEELDPKEYAASDPKAANETTVSEPESQPVPTAAT